MWKAEYHTSWLMGNLTVCESAETRFPDIYNKYQAQGGTLSAPVIGKYLCQLFDEIKIVKKLNHVTSKDEKVYTGLSVKNVQNDAVSENLHEIKEWVPSPFFVCSDEPHEIHVGMICDTKINGNPVIKKIIFKKDNTWDFYIGDKSINVKEIGIDNSFVLARQVIQTIFSIANKVRLCLGKEKENTDNLILHHHVTEFVGTEKTLVYRSLKCIRVIPFLNIGSCCRFCNIFRRTVPEATSSCKNAKFVTLGENAPDIPKHPELPVSNDQSYSHSLSLQVHDTDKLVLKENNDKDMRAILEQVLPEASGEMLDILVEQKKNMTRNPNGRRWDPKTISFCLGLWCRSQKNYNMLKDSKILTLPSAQTLRLYKNSVDQGSGFNKEVMKWMAETASQTKVKDGGMCGGIAIDEMSIQEDLCLVHSNGEVKLVGFVDIGEESDCFQKLCSKLNQKYLATHVLQFVYIGLNGFRFPFACFPVTQTKPGDLHFLFWNAVKMLNIYGFKVSFVSMDGAQTNRDFMKMFFRDVLPSVANFSVQNIWFPKHPPIIFIMDYSHVMKRIRNNISKSGENHSNKRQLLYRYPIHWEHWVNAFKWDRDTNSFPIHHKLTNEHFYLTQDSKMRNKLAEDVLNSEMLNLMMSFQSSIGDTGYVLDDSINLLKATSKMVSVFRDRRPITDIEDIRLEHLNESITWFGDWENFVLYKDDIESSKKEKMLISYQTREDIRSCMIGFTQLCKNILKDDRSSIVPARVNSDVIENVFCQQRGIINGNNTNPTFYQYSKNINSVIIGQSALSKTCNTGSGQSSSVTILPTQKPPKTKAVSSPKNPLHTVK